MRIAFLGATSQIAKDLVLSFSVSEQHELVLFARRPEAVKEWLTEFSLMGKYQVDSFDAFSADDHFDAIINFVGVGNPAQALEMGASIFDITLKYDNMALEYLRRNGSCRYLFLSSGAAYGSNFDEPVDSFSSALIPINNLRPQDWYGVAKLHAECRHRALPDFSIIDIRVFNYFSHTQDITAKFFIADVCRAIQSKKIFSTSSGNIYRDYMGAADFHQLIASILNAAPFNDVLDCYTLDPVDKWQLLDRLKNDFDLDVDVKATPVGINATGVKINYFSKNRCAANIGYVPTKTSLELIVDEIKMLISKSNSK
jgi:nucleoside-diphosphate-sugar epimerase